MADASVANSSGASTISSRWKIVISALLILHLTAVIVSPLSIEGSPLAGGLWQFFRPYVHAAYLNHGYHFFAPQPGPSHLVRYEVDLPDGGQVTGTFPDRNTHRPRLFYHRHFMLSEFLNVLHGQAQGITDPAAPPKQIFDAYCESYARHLLAKHEGEKVTIRLTRHQIPYPDEVAAGRPLNDPKLYEELFKRTYEANRP